MKTKKEIRKEIKDVEVGYNHILILPSADFQINGPRAATQILAIAKLQVLYWAIDEKMPKFECHK